MIIAENLYGGQSSRDAEEWTMNRAGKAIWVATLAFAFVVSALAVVPARAGTESITLYGGMSTGWGSTSSSLSNPGPTITVNQGDTVVLALHSVDPATTTHNWFIDYNNNLAADPGEPKSTDFSGTTAGSFTFTASRIGTFTYRCAYHPTTMTGVIVIRAPPTFELYGDGIRGWGEQNTTTGITKPGPTLVVNVSQSVTIEVHSADGMLHSWFIDLNNDSVQQASEPHSNDTASSTRYTFTVSLSAGTYTYRCQYHPTMMFGSITVRSSGGGGGGTTTDTTTLTIGGIIIVVAIVAIVAAVVLRRKKP